MGFNNLRQAFEEMWDFIADSPSGTDGMVSDFESAFGELEETEKIRQWIPCREKMPEDVIPSKAKQIKVLVTIKNKNGYCVRSQTRMKDKYYEWNGEWEWGKYTAGDIVAWMPLPEPYKEEEDDD